MACENDVVQESALDEGLRWLFATSGLFGTAAATTGVVVASKAADVSPLIGATSATVTGLVGIWVACAMISRACSLDNKSRGESLAPGEETFAYHMKSTGRDLASIFKPD